MYFKNLLTTLVSYSALIACQNHLNESRMYKNYFNEKDSSSNERKEKEITTTNFSNKKIENKNLEQTQDNFAINGPLFKSYENLTKVVYEYSKKCGSYFSNSPIQYLSEKDRKTDLKKDIINNCLIYGNLFENYGYEKIVIDFKPDNREKLLEILRKIEITVTIDLYQFNKSTNLFFANDKSISNDEKNKFIAQFNLFEKIVYPKFKAEYAKILKNESESRSNSEVSSIISKSEIEDIVNIPTTNKCSLEIEESRKIRENIFFTKKNEPSIEVFSPIILFSKRNSKKNKTHISASIRKSYETIEKEEVFEELKKRASSLDTIKNRVKANKFSEKALALKKYIVDLCKDKKDNVKALKTLLLAEFSEIKSISSDNNVIKITLEDGNIIPTHHKHKNSARITFEKILAEAILKIREDKMKK